MVGPHLKPILTTSCLAEMFRAYLPRDSVRHTLQSGLLLIRFLSSFFVASEQNDCKYDYISNYGHFDAACDIYLHYYDHL